MGLQLGRSHLPCPAVPWQKAPSLDRNLSSRLNNFCLLFQHSVHLSWFIFEHRIYIYMIRPIHHALNNADNGTLKLCLLSIEQGRLAINMLIWTGLQLSQNVNWQRWTAWVTKSLQLLKSKMCPSNCPTTVILWIPVGIYYKK